MIEQQKRLVTPTKLEYNIDAQTTTFNVIEEIEKLLQMISREDSTVRIQEVETKTLLWSQDQRLPEGEQFRTKFKMREQTFRKGTKK